MKDSFQNHIDSLFRNMLQFHKKDPERHIWENIERELDKEDKAALINKRKTGLKRTGGLLLIFFSLGSAFFYYEMHPVRPGKSIISFNDNKSGTGKPTLKPLISSHIGPVSLAPGYKVNFYLRKNGIEMRNTRPLISDLNRSIAIINIDFIPVNVTDRIYQSIRFPEKRPLFLQLFVAQHSIKLQESKFRDRISITPYFSQEFAGYNFADNDITAPNGKHVEKAERNIFSASVGVYVNYKINKKWMVQSGFSYSWSRSIMDSSQSYAVQNAAGDIAFKLNTGSGFSFLHSPSFIVPMVGDSMATAKTHSELHYITIPLVLSYRIPLHRFTLLAGAGMTFNVLAHATLETDIYGANYRQNESEIPLRGLKKINLGMLVKTEIQYHLTSKMSVSLIPSFKNTLGPINMTNSSLSAYPYNFGIGAGIVYLF